MLYAPPEGPTFHQHFNTSNVSSRYLAILFGGGRYSQGTVRRSWQYDNPDVDVKLGGMQIEYEDEEPRILELYERELAKAGIRSRMAEFIRR